MEIEKKTDASKFNSNFHQVNLLRAEDGSEFESWIKYKKMENDISKIQNEIVEVCFKKHKMGNMDLSIEVIYTECYRKLLFIVITIC